MFGFLRKLFGPTKVEVTVHVEDIRVIISKPESEDRSQPTSNSRERTIEDRRTTITAPEVTDEEKLEEIGERFKNIRTPDVQFGEDK